MIRSFEKITGNYVTEIKGQNKFGYYLTSFVDFYDMREIKDYYGGIIRFYDFETCKVYEPFVVKRNVLYGEPLFYDGKLYFLKADFNEKMISLYHYYPEKECEVIFRIETDKVNLYNLKVMGDKVHVTSQDSVFTCYYPENTSFVIGERETVDYIDGDKIYCSEWQEEQNEETGEYKYFEYLIIRDFRGTILNRQLGSLMQRHDGSLFIG